MHDARIPAHPGLEPGRRIGRYRLVRRIGAGGMGTVFEAEQDEPRRVVALKLLARAEDPEAIARFRYEAEVLAQLSHPGIAQIFEAGVERELGGDAPSELPWFAMEHVPGARTILEYAEAEQLALAQRLRLFLRVADAVRHGHEKGVVHRDLKPANLLVDAAGNPKVIDFGIARITSAEGPQRSLRTSTGQVLGTLRYMSPEQVSGAHGAVDVRSDVFALGLVLFELVARRPAYDLEALSLTEAVRAVAEARVPSLRSVSRALPAELEWIVQRACAPERERRYASVSELATDVERYLTGEAISAAPPDTLYRLRRFVRCHHLAVSALGLVVASLAVSIAILARGLGIEQRALANEREERARAQGNAAFLSEMLSSVAPTKGGYEVRLTDVLDEAAPRIDERFGAQPLLAADLHVAIAASYRRLFRTKETLQHARAALELREARLGAEDPNTLSARELYAIALRDAGRPAEAEPIVRERIAALEREGAGDPMRLEDLRSTLVDLLIDSGRLDEAAEALDAWLDGATPESLELDELGLLKAQHALRLALEQRDLDGMLAWLDRVASEGDRLPPELAVSCGSMLANRGITLLETGHPEEAVQAFQDALEKSERLFGPASHPAIATRMNLANVDLQRNDGAAALEQIERASAAAERGFAPDHPLRLQIRYSRCGALWVKGEKERAAAELAPLIEEAHRVRPQEHAETAEWEGSLGRMYVALGRPDEGLPWLESSVTTLSAQHGDADPTTQLSLRWLVRALDESGMTEQAEELRPRLVQRSP